MTILQPSRRRFLFGTSAFLAAPAIVRAASIMPVSVPRPESWADFWTWIGPPPPIEPGRLALDNIRAILVRLDQTVAGPPTVMVHENFLKDWQAAA